MPTTPGSYPKCIMGVPPMVVMICLLASAGRGAILLPLQGYCRPGRYFPIQLDGSDATAFWTFSGEGCLTTQVLPRSPGRRIVPMLVTASPASLNVDPPTRLEQLLRIPSDDERLIGRTTVDISIAAAVFPTEKLIAISLDVADPLPGPPAAWETLDAVLLDAAEFSRINDAQRSALLAGGVRLICAGNAPPDSRWPWQHRGTAWVLSCTLAGPVDQTVNEEVYAPTYAWNPGWSAVVRGQVMGAGALLVLFTITLLLRPNRWTMSFAILLMIVASIGIAAWRRSLGNIARAGGDVLIARSGLLQRDAWVYERARDSGSQSVAWNNWTHPMFASGSALRSSQMQLNVSSTGELQFTYAAVAGHTMAFVRREILPGEMPVADQPFRSPMLEVARSVYLGPGDQIAGESIGGPERWGTVVERSAATQATVIPSGKE